MPSDRLALGHGRSGANAVWVNLGMAGFVLSVALDSAITMIECRLHCVGFCSVSTQLGISF